MLEQTIDLTTLYTARNDYNGSYMSDQRMTPLAVLISIIIANLSIEYSSHGACRRVSIPSMSVKGGGGGGGG